MDICIFNVLQKIKYFKIPVNDYAKLYIKEELPILL